MQYAKTGRCLEKYVNLLTAVMYEMLRLIFPEILKKTLLCVFVFNIQPTAKDIWRRGRSLKSHPIDW